MAGFLNDLTVREALDSGGAADRWKVTLGADELELWRMSSLGKEQLASLQDCLFVLLNSESSCLPRVWGVDILHQDWDGKNGLRGQTGDAWILVESLESRSWVTSSKLALRVIAQGLAELHSKGMSHGNVEEALQWAFSGRLWVGGLPFGRVAKKGQTARG